MTWYPAYLDDKQELVDFVKTQRPTLKVDDIYDVDLKFADAAIFSYLYKFGGIKVSYIGTTSGNDSNVPDQLQLLWGASLAYNCEFLSYRGIISYNVGGVEENRRGSVATKFMRMQPMFFMGNNPENMDAVMPFRSFKQIAQQFLDSFIKLYNNESGATQAYKPQMAWDTTARGYGANADWDTYHAPQDNELTGTRT